MGLAGSFVPAFAGQVDGKLPVIRPGGPVFLLAEDLLDDHWGVRRRLVPAEKSARNPLIRNDRPWEGLGPYVYGSVLRDPKDSLWKCWYTVYNNAAYQARQPWAYRIAYATSRDGIAWEKPELGIVNVDGSTKNNIVRIGGRMSEAIDVCLAPPEANAPARFVALILDGGIQLWISDDGLRWRPLEGNPVDAGHSDCHNSLCWDAARKRWLIHLRPPVYAHTRNKRRIALMESTDLRTWTRPLTVLSPDEQDPPEFYSMPVFQRGNLFFGLLQIYDRRRESLEIELVYSADGSRWHRLPKRPLFLPTGPEGSFDSGMITTADDVIVDGDRMLFYYGGWNGDHKSQTRNAAIGVASVGKDRLVAWEDGGAEPGFLLTKPCVLEGTRLTLNAAVRGRMQAAIADLNGKPLPGFEYENCREVKGDSQRHVVAWSERSPGELRGKPVRVRLQMENTSFYSLALE
jgi:hypothetical protein